MIVSHLSHPSHLLTLLSLHTGRHYLHRWSSLTLLILLSLLTLLSLLYLRIGCNYLHRWAGRHRDQAVWRGTVWRQRGETSHCNSHSTSDCNGDGTSDFITFLTFFTLLPPARINPRNSTGGFRPIARIDMSRSKYIIMNELLSSLEHIREKDVLE